jgi:urease accessory protein
MKPFLVNFALTLALTLLTNTAFAHSGHQHDGFMAGLAHPYAADHLIVMFAVGLWSVVRFTGERVFAGPIVFFAGLMFGAILGSILGSIGLGAPSVLELLIALNVVGLGALLFLTPRAQGEGAQFMTKAGALLIAVTGVLHGASHGTEAPVAQMLSFTSGYVITTLTLVCAGVAIGALLKEQVLANGGRLLKLLGLVAVVAGLQLMKAA